MFGGVMAVVDQGRVVLGGSTYDGATATLPGIYKLPTADFHDILTGNNGYSAGKGYDLVTGIGSPISNLFVPDLVNGISVITTPPAVGGIDSSTLSYKVGGAPLAIAPSITLTDASSTTLTGAIINFSSGYVTNNDWLSFTNTANISGSYFYATGRLVLTGTASLAEYQAAIRSITYRFTGRLPSSSVRQISIQVTDSSTPNYYDSNIVTKKLVVQ